MITIKKDKALFLANHVIRCIEATRVHCFWKRVAMELNKKYVGFWLWRRPITLKDAEDAVVERGGLFNDWEIKCWGPYGTAKRVAEAVAIADGDTIQLDLRSAQTLHDFTGRRPDIRV